MTKTEYIEYWIKTANKDWDAIQVMVKGKLYVYALFWSHLVLEKLCKAHWVKDNTGNHPPKIHNLLTIVRSTKLSLTEEQLKFLALMNDFQLEGRYPDYQNRMYKRCNSGYTKNIIKQVNSIRQCLLKSLP